MITLHTALCIQNQKVIATAGGPSTKNGKYVGWIMLDVERWHPLLNTEPIFETESQARKAMEDLVAAVKKADLSKDIEYLKDLLNGKA